VEEELLALFPVFNHSAWYSRVDIQSAKEWEDGIKGGLESSDWFVVVMSPNSAASEWVKKELEWAMSNRRGNILPLLIAPCPMSDFHEHLPRIQYIDLVTEPARGRIQLMQYLKDAKPVRAISGDWKGRVIPHLGPSGQPAELMLEGSLTVHGNTVTGSIKFLLPDLWKWVGTNYSVNGVLLDARFLQLDYVCGDPGRMQFGCILLEIDPTGKKMTGKLAGFGAINQTLITADVMIEKTV
jgi:hypothetical protein